MNFNNRTILVTGGTSGIGRATVALFARAGATVGVNHIGQHEAFIELEKELAEAPGKLIELEANVTDAIQIRVAIDKLLSATNRLDVLVNNAGISLIKPFLEITEEEWDHVVDTDLKSVFLCCQAAIPELIKTQGAIVNIASELAISGRAKFAPYTAAKGGIISLTRSLAREFAPTVRVNAVAPGPTSTPMLAAEAAVPGHSENTADIPMGRYAHPMEIANSIVFLASEQAGYFCGDVLSPNGGAVMR
jgi:3-oxoacyl-[acyl-carrier protein] reductase